MSSYPARYLKIVEQISQQIDVPTIDKMVDILQTLRTQRGRLFILGVGGSAANCSHAVNDFRKIVGIEAYAPSDNVAELTARANDEGWETIFSGWLKVSNLSARDALLVLSVGGGNREKNISVNLIKAVELAKERGAKVLGILGRDGGYTGQHADACVIIPTFDSAMITPQAEAWQGIIWHLLVSDPRLLAMTNKWESYNHEAVKPSLGLQI